MEHRGRMTDSVRENLEMRIENLKRIYQDEFKSIRDEISVTKQTNKKTK